MHTRVRDERTLKNLHTSVMDFVHASKYLEITVEQVSLSFVRSGSGSQTKLVRILGQCRALSP